MGFEKGNPGRPKGAKNKHSFKVEELAQKYKMEPFDFLSATFNNDWETLGFAGPTKTSFTNAGIEFEEDNIPMKDRVMAAKEAAKYLYSAKQAVQISTPEEGFKIIVTEYKK